MSDAPVTIQPAAPTLSATFARLSWPARASLAGLAAAVIAQSVRLWPEWRHNPDLSHGLFMPVVFLLLLNESRTGTQRWLRAGPATTAVFAALLLGGLASLAAAGLYAATLDWNHALVQFMLTASLTLLLGAGLVAFAGESLRVLPLNWSAVVALGLWLLSSPFPNGFYSRLTLGLQLLVSENTLRALHLLGIAAVRHGNIIELARATVGVEEACSGVRSLISCVFAGLVFSATLVRRPAARALIIGLSAPLALVMNFLRSFLLTLLANSGVEIAGTWHDATGFAVLGVTAVILGGLALLLEHGEKNISAPAAPGSEGSPAISRLSRYQVPALLTTLSLTAALVTFFVLNTRPSARRDAPVPDLLALLPASAPGWRVETSSDIYKFRAALETEFLAQRSYLRDTPTGLQQITLYVAYWRPGQVPVSMVASHTPDACWPGSGWVAAQAPAEEPPAVSGRTLPGTEYRLFRNADFPQYVWFWHLFDGRPIAYRDPYSPIALLRIAWRFGFRHDGDQLYVRVSSNRPWTELANEPLMAEFFSHTKPLGL